MEDLEIVLGWGPRAYFCALSIPSCFCDLRVAVLASVGKYSRLDCSGQNSRLRGFLPLLTDGISRSLSSRTSFNGEEFKHNVKSINVRHTPVMGRHYPVLYLNIFFKFSINHPRHLAGPQLSYGLLRGRLPAGMRTLARLAGGSSVISSSAIHGLICCKRYPAHFGQLSYI